MLVVEHGDSQTPQHMAGIAPQRGTPLILMLPNLQDHCPESSSVFTRPLRDECCHLHFADEETEAQEVK